MPATIVTYKGATLATSSDFSGAALGSPTGGVLAPANQSVPVVATGVFVPPPALVAVPGPIISPQVAADNNWQGGNPLSGGITNQPRILQATVGDAPGTVGIASVRRSVDSANPMTGQKAQDITRNASETIYSALLKGIGLPNDSQRETLSKRLAALSLAVEKYGASDIVPEYVAQDVRDSTVQAYIEYNSVLEGNAVATSNFNRLVEDLATNAAKVPAQILGGVLNTVADAIPSGLSAVLIIAVVIGAGVVTWKVLS